jgi:lysophospholipase L1-like esterase
MSKARCLSVLLCVSVLVNLIFLFCGGLYIFYVRKHGGVARFMEEYGAPHPIALNRNMESLVRNSLFKTLESSPVGSPAVFLGDSLTEQCEWDELLSAPVLNRGISNDTTLDILNRLDPVLALHPKAIYLMIGINDAAQRSSVADAAERYQQILQNIHKASPATRVYIQSLLPVLSSGALVRSLRRNRGPALNQWVQQMNQRLSSFADGRSTFYVNIHDDLLENGELAPRYTVDGIHLTGTGYQVWKKRILTFVPRP